MEYHLNGWFIRASRIEMDDLGVPLFQETSIYCNDLQLMVNIYSCGDSESGPKDSVEPWFFHQAAW